MTLMSGALDKSVLDGNTLLLKIGEENDKHRYIYIYIYRWRYDMFFSNDNIYEYISNMGNSLTPYSIAVGHENIYFLTPHFEFIKREKINVNDLLKN